MDSAGHLTATGSVSPPASWMGPDGVRHEIENQVSVHLGLTDEGAVERVIVLPDRYGYGGDVAGGAFATNFGSNLAVVLNEGTPWAFPIGGVGAPQGLMGWLRDDGIVECAWTIEGHAYDAVRDEAGGFVVVGSLTGEAVVRDRTDQQVHDFGGSVVGGSGDGFILRFAWRDPP